MPTKEQISRRIESLGFWFQNFTLEGIETNPEKPDNSAVRWELLEPLVPENLNGKTVLDLGCNAGYFSIKMRERGAEVLGVDWYPDAIEQAEFVAEVLGHDIEYQVANIYEFVLQTDRRFDYVIFMGVFYHLRYPLLVLDRIAAITNQEMFFQTVTRETPDSTPEIPSDITDYDIMNEPGFPHLHFIEGNLAGAYNNWFVCNQSGVEAVLRSSGFRNLRCRGDVYACETDPEIAASWRASHDLFAIKKAEPKENIG